MEDAPDRIIVRIKSSVAREAMTWLYDQEKDKESFREGYERTLEQIERNHGRSLSAYYSVSFPIYHRDMAMRFKLTWGGE